MSKIRKSKISYKDMVKNKDLTEFDENSKRMAGLDKEKKGKEDQED